MRDGVYVPWRQGFPHRTQGPGGSGADQGNSAGNSAMVEGIAQLNVAKSISGLVKARGVRVLCTFITPSDLQGYVLVGKLSGLFLLAIH